MEKLDKWKNENEKKRKGLLSASAGGYGTDQFSIFRMATMFRILIPDGIKFRNQQVRFPMTRFWKVCTRCENTRVWSTQNSIGNVWTRNQSKSFEAELSEVEDHGKETKRSKDQDTKFSSQKRKNWNSSGKDSKTEECQRWQETRRLLSVESKGTRYEGRYLQPPPRRQSAWKECTIVLSCPKTAGTEWRKKSFQKRNQNTLMATVRIWRVIIGILPYVKITTSESGCEFDEKVHIQAQEVDSQPNKTPKKNGGEGSVALLKNSKQMGCVSQDAEPLKSRSILRKSTKFLGSKRSVRLPHFTTQKLGKERVHCREVCRSVNLTSVVLVPQKVWGQNTGRNLETRTMRPQRSMGFGEKWP